MRVLTGVQITSSAGAPYTLYLDIPSPLELGGKEGGVEVKTETPMERVESVDDTHIRERGKVKDDDRISRSASPISIASDISRVSPPIPADPAVQAADLEPGSNDNDRGQRAAHLQDTITKLGSMFCPCPGFAYNSLTGERNVFVSRASADQA